MNVTIIGTGFVGVTTAAVYASQGHHVWGVDIDPDKVEALKVGRVPFFEPDLEKMISEQVKNGNLSFTTSYTVAVPEADVVMIAVGTPSLPTGDINDQYVIAACQAVGSHLKNGAIVVVKSTVPPYLIEKFEKAVASTAKVEFYLATMPEFLKEGTAVADTLYPDRVVIGTTNAGVAEKLTQLHQGIDAPVLVVSPQSAQMIKYTANSYLAQRISFINQIADICDKVGADVQEVIQGIGFDKRIGSHYWYPGLGYGGSCFPKDVRELSHLADMVGYSDNVFSWMNKANEARADLKMAEFSEKVGGWKGKKVAVLGLAFKPNTDDTREAPANFVIPYLLNAGASVRGYDPKAKFTVPKQLKNVAANYQPADTIESACEQADVIMLLIEWPELVAFQYNTVKNNDTRQWLIDVRNQLQPTKVAEAGFHYIGMGRRA